MNNWREIPGRKDDIGVGSDGTVWAIGKGTGMPWTLNDD
jgi:hypothetical protein